MYELYLLTAGLVKFKLLAPVLGIHLLLSVVSYQRFKKQALNPLTALLASVGVFTLTLLLGQLLCYALGVPLIEDTNVSFYVR
jgi:small neutral amino acid transporter SnatA (MarC family)